MTRPSRRIPDSVKTHLWQNSRGMCAYPGCRKKLSLPGNENDGPVTIGEVAHIFAYSSGGPRPNPDMNTQAANDYNNLILLCRNHHREVDQQPNTFTATDLIRWKTELEFWVDQQLRQGEFYSADIESLVNRLENVSILEPSADFELIGVAAKISLNQLTESVQATISMGLARAHEVEKHINTLSVLDSNFVERLLSPLKHRYVELTETGLSADLVFNGLRSYAGGNTHDFQTQCAAACVIVYFFHKCDLFEKS